MTIEKTVIEWPFAPSDFFESPVYHLDSDYDLDIKNGRARATLKAPTDLVPAELTASIQAKIQPIFDVRLLQHTPLQPYEAALVVWLGTGLTLHGQIADNDLPHPGHALD
jgi:hypothetical protein